MAACRQTSDGFAQDGCKSFDDPDRRTSSVDDQPQAAKAYAKRNGFRLITFHGDDGIEGATMKRFALTSLLAAIRRGDAKVVIIEDVDRPGRNQEHLQHMMKIFRAHGVVLDTVAAGVIDELVFSFKGIVGEQQRIRITRKSKLNPETNRPRRAGDADRRPRALGSVQGAAGRGAARP